MAGTNNMHSHERTPAFPTRQMTILAMCRICEPIAFMSIFPYVYQMIRDFKITTEEPIIAVYAGMVTSAFAFAEFSSGVPWGRLSDKIGRKPVLLTGLAGTALSMLIFGFATSLPVALLARALGGLLNGNIGVLQTTVAEMVTVKEHQPRAYTIMPFVWCLGSIVGPALGGALARPAQPENYPSIFHPGSIWDQFPYLLPNLVCTVIVVCGVVVGMLFLEETHAEKKHRRDPGLEAGKWILRKFGGCTKSKQSRCEKDSDLDELISLLGEDEQPPGYRTTDGSPKIPSTPSAEPQEPIDVHYHDHNHDHDHDHVVPRCKPAVTKAFTRHVVLNIVGYGILAYHTMTFDAMLPTLLASNPDEHRENWVLPIKFVGGYGMHTSEIGSILAIQGVYSMLVTIFVFPIVTRKLGALKLFRLISLSYPILYLTTPYLVLLPDSLRIAGVYAVVLWKCTFATMAYPSNAILLTNSAPSLLMLGTINGVAASTASLSRAFGPTVSGILFSAGLQLGYSGMAWWCSAVIAVAGAIISLRMSDKGGRMDADEKADEDPEPAFEDHILDSNALDCALAAEAQADDSNPDNLII